MRHRPPTSACGRSGETPPSTPDARMPSMSKTAQFHPAVARWFNREFPAPTPAQAQAWPLIASGRNVLIAAPTGSGKTLAAFLAAIDGLVRRGVEAPLPDETLVVYVSPLKALSNDIQKNLAAPLAGIREELDALGLPDVEIRTLVRTGDTPQAERAGMRKRPPHIVVTTPESLYVLLGSESGRTMLATTRTVIVDEIHALAGNKRGSHLALSLERLARSARTPPVRIGLSATQKPIDEIARFLVGVPVTGGRAPATRKCAIVDSGHVRVRDLALEVPSSPLEAVMSHEVWEQVYARLAQLAREHRTTLVFVNTRRMAERAARHLSELLGAEFVMSHHGSMAKELRLKAEQRLKNGELRCSSPRRRSSSASTSATSSSSASWARRGRSRRSCSAPAARAIRSAACPRHDSSRCRATSSSNARRCSTRCAAASSTGSRFRARRSTCSRSRSSPRSRRGNGPKTRLFDLVAPRVSLRGADARRIPGRRAHRWPKASATRRGHRAAYVHRDAVNGMLRGRRGARLTALTSGGAIPDNADYDVVLEPAGQVVGTVNEDFAVESLAGDIFQLGNTSYGSGASRRAACASRMRTDRRRRFRSGWARRRGAPTSCRCAVSRLREEIVAQDRPRAVTPRQRSRTSASTPGIAEGAATQLVDYLAIARAALGTLPDAADGSCSSASSTSRAACSSSSTRRSAAGSTARGDSRCASASAAKFNFELQAAATEDAIVLSLSTSHSFALAAVARYLHSKTVREVLIQAMLDAPMFAARWRWIAGIVARAAALPRRQEGAGAAAADARGGSDGRGVPGSDRLRREPRRRPRDSRSSARRARRCTIACTRRWTSTVSSVCCAASRAAASRSSRATWPMPSPLALEILTARPYAYLDDAPLEERRTQAVMGRRWLDEASASDARPARRCRDRHACATEAWPEAGNADELHDALLGLAFVTPAEVDRSAGWRRSSTISHDNVARRAARARAGCRRRGLWVAAERLPQFAARLPGRRAIARDRGAGRVRAPGLDARGGAGRDRAFAPRGAGPGHRGDPSPRRWESRARTSRTALATLVAEGVAMERVLHAVVAPAGMVRSRAARAHPSLHGASGCARRSSPSATQDFMRFLFRWQHLVPHERREGPDALDAVISQLQGFEAPVAAWETEILPARLDDYDFTWLDDLCLSGRAVWTRLTPPGGGIATSHAGPIRTTPVTLLPREAASAWQRVAPASRHELAAGELARAGGGRASARARRVVLRRDRRRQRSAAHAGRGGARRAGRVRARPRPTASPGCAHC